MLKTFSSLTDKQQCMVSGQVPKMAECTVHTTCLSQLKYLDISVNKILLVKVMQTLAMEKNATETG